MKKLEDIVNKMNENIKDIQQTLGNGGEGKKVKAAEEEDTIKGVNVSQLPCRNVYTYGLKLIDMLFTKEELKNSLLYKLVQI